ncbi:MAG: bifunctional phosphopantothenoylcysteine decarboxylase/phosphopantothenate--cysteine ligase CoaBC [Deltaproteobacteria bacterium]|nr:bifunctional phosphopantothenoylcysteine decarboxylase/phosphopantothenate--cysteine ligase CoaBC [Deltaproteobacteria bacterium]
MNGKEVIVGVTGGIAAYKAAELVRLLKREDLMVRVAMTKSATRFVTPLTFEALSGERVIHRMFHREGSAIDHIRWGQESDLIIIAPATANFIGKMAHGIGDDFLSTCVLAATAKILICPSMNVKMFENRAVQENLNLLEKRGFMVMDPTRGDLACGTEGPGRLPEPAMIKERAMMLLSRQDLSGLKIMISAGPTVEPIDPVRYISNRSSGKMGYAISRAAVRRGAQVILVSGPTGLNPSSGLTFLPVKTAEEMKRTVFENRSGCDIIIKAAAVSDYRPREYAGQKIKKGAESLSLHLVKNPDILAELGSERGDSSTILVGFAAETEELLLNAEKKLRSKDLDMIVANDVSRKDAGFETDTNLVKFIYRDGRVEEVPLMAKDRVADLVLDRARALREARLEG